MVILREYRFLTFLSVFILLMDYLENYTNSQYYDEGLSLKRNRVSTHNQVTNNIDTSLRNEVSGTLTQVRYASKILLEIF